MKKMKRQATVPDVQLRSDINETKDDDGIAASFAARRRCVFFASFSLTHARSRSCCPPLACARTTEQEKAVEHLKSARVKKTL